MQGGTVIRKPKPPRIVRVTYVRGERGWTGPVLSPSGEHFRDVCRLWEPAQRVTFVYDLRRAGR